MPCLSLGLVSNLSSSRRRMKSKFKAAARGGRGGGFVASAGVWGEDAAYWMVSRALAGSCDLQVLVDPGQAVL